jgi:hypothetical protein
VIVEISPGPSAAEREAIEAALGAAFAADGHQLGDWWREGLEENLGADAGLEATPASGASVP